MKYRIIVLLLAVLIVVACDKSDQQTTIRNESTVSPPVDTSRLSTEPDDLIIPGAIFNKRKQLDTKITPDMLNGIKFDATAGDADMYTDKPFNLDPAGSTRISVTPKLIFKEELDLTQSYMDNIYGAFIQFEMKFN